jgi:hypothetical protein
LKFCSTRLEAIAALLTRAVFGLLVLWAGGESAFAFAEFLPGTACPPDFSCFTPPPRDGACQHSAIVLDTKLKATRWEENPTSRESEKACIAQTDSSATRRDNELHLEFRDGSSRVYKDNPAACEKGFENCAEYVLYDYFPQHELFLISVAYYEGGRWLLVSRLDGKEEEIVGQPAYSPSRKWLASANSNEGPGGDAFNGVDIIPADLDPREPALHYKPSDYELWEFVRWDTDNRLLLKVTWHGDKDRPSETITSAAEVFLQDGQWQFKNWPPASQP